MTQVGKYQLIRKLATGGMAEVFLAKAAGPMGFEKTLVLKRILPHLAEEPSFVEMFLGEARLAAQLTHPHIVQIFDFGESDGTYFLAMEYIDGPSLRALIKRASAKGQPLPPAVCARLISQACEGLAFAHDLTDPNTGALLGLVHRDISPDNILLSKQGTVKVVDFGIAKAAGQSHRTETGIVKGKIGYMAPEQLRAQPMDRRTDVYALGVVLYELLTARRPFEAPSDVALIQIILTQPPLPAVQLRPDLPEALQRILERALAQDREQRYPDCHAFQSDLEDFILSVGRPVTAQQVAQLIVRVTENELPAQPVPPVPSLQAPTHSRQTTAVGASDTAPTERTPRSWVREVTAEAPVAAPEPVAPERGEDRAQQAVPLPRTPAWSRLAFMGGVLFLTGSGVVVWRKVSMSEQPVVSPHRSTPELSPNPAPVIQPPAPAPVTTPPVIEAVAPREEPAPKPEEPPPPSIPKQDPPKQDPPKSPRVVASAPKGNGTLELRIRPFAKVFIDGKERGDTPMPPLELSAGKHTVKLIHPPTSKTISRKVEVKVGQPTLLKVNLMEED